ncbi:MAG: HD domain-containing protein [Candidatus Latescibacteria bacterium]|nr:HD domain-containing protein [Candidatus Latescibacterota bacterium]
MVQEIENYYPINLGILRLDTIRNFDVFLQLQNKKLILYHAGGERFTLSVKDNLLEHNVSTLFVKKRDKVLCLRYIEENLPGILADPSISLSYRSRLAHQTITFIARSLFESQRAKTVKRFKSAIFSTMDLVLSSEHVLAHLIQLTSHDYHTFAHSINVGIFGIGLAIEVFKDRSEHDMKEMAAGFFLHDIGKCLISPTILTKRGPLTDHEWKIMKRHPADGYKMLSKLNALSIEAKVIVLQHHERHDGKGYPKGLKGNEIHIYSKICCIADVFDALTAMRPHKQPHNSFNALRIMKNEMKGEFDPEFFARFVMLFSRNKYVPKSDNSSTGKII